MIFIEMTQRVGNMLERNSKYKSSLFVIDFIIGFSWNSFDVTWVMELTKTQLRCKQLVAILLLLNLSALNENSKD